MRDLSQNSTQSHAPRERVSWNRGGAAPTTITPVTLHVSVWVEITKKFLTKAMRSSRSTWACELKFALWCTKRNIKGHAPRERVSWNNTSKTSRDCASVTLHVSVWVEIFILDILYTAFTSRSTWACELKCVRMPLADHSERSRSTWACELKFQKSYNYTLFITSRSTWACESIFVSTQDLSILNNTNNRLTKVGRYFYTQILYIFHVFSVKSANSHPEISANKWFII